jgi:hypothetical protein
MGEREFAPLAPRIVQVRPHEVCDLPLSDLSTEDSPWRILCLRRPSPGVRAPGSWVGRTAGLAVPVVLPVPRDALHQPRQAAARQAGLQAGVVGAADQPDEPRCAGGAGVGGHRHLRQFNRDDLGGLYSWVVLVEENDLRLIDVGMLSKLPVGDSLAG